MKLFIDKEEKIEIKVNIAEDNKGDLVASISLEELLKDKDVVTPKEDIHEYIFYFRKPSYKDNVDVLSKTLKQNLQFGDEDVSNNTVSIDPVLVQYARFQSLLIDWTLKDEEGNKLPITKSRIDNLNPVIANTVMTELDDILS